MARCGTYKGYIGAAGNKLGIVDVERFFAGFKMVLGLVAIGVWLASIQYVLFYESSFDDLKSNSSSVELTAWQRYTKFLGNFGYGYLWGEHPTWKRTYEKGCLEKNWYGCNAQTTPEEFLLILVKRHPRRYVDILMISCGFFYLAFGFFFLRRPTPVRFNRNLGAIYTWHRGKLWIHPQYIFDYDYKPGLNLLSGGGFNGPMRIKLQSSRNPRKLKTFKLGTYPFPCGGYGQFLAKRLQEFMRGSYEDRDRGWSKDLKYPWWQRSLLGRKELPDDIDARAEEWLRKYKYL
jgi:hypothetical protein